MCLIYLLMSLIPVVVGATTDSYKDQYCTDPRTMQKHAVYSEWPDSYSCTRHRCQPGGRNLAIYTVGCKRVEAPESAIECEEVVEDTNMQFPFCCTRLRCLVVVRGEVWTRVLGQPWETLPAAPWSHMYKMKKPPPGENAFSNKNADVKGPVYELQADNANDHEKVLRASKKQSSSTTECNEPVARAAPSPDIVIALATPNDEKKNKNENSRLKLKISSERIDENEEAEKEHFDIEIDDGPGNEKASWTEIPQNQWNEHDPAMDVESPHERDIPVPKTEKPSGLQALVDAIGNRMRDIESVVQKMSEKVRKPDNEFASGERRSDNEAPRKHQKPDDKFHGKEELENPKKASPDDEHHKSRFSVKNRGSKYLHNNNNDVTSEQPVIVDDTNLNGYFSVMRRSMPKEPAAPTYMAPVENRRKTHDVSAEGDKKHKKHTHKRKHKGKGRKKHHIKEDKKKHINVLASAELDKNVVSLEDSGTNF